MARKCRFQRPRSQSDATKPHYSLDKQAGGRLFYPHAALRSTAQTPGSPIHEPCAAVKQPPPTTVFPKRSCYGRTERNRSRLQDCPTMPPGQSPTHVHPGDHLSASLTRTTRVRTCASTPGSRFCSPLPRSSSTPFWQLRWELFCLLIPFLLHMMFWRLIGLAWLIVWLLCVINAVARQAVQAAVHRGPLPSRWPTNSRTRGLRGGFPEQALR